MKNHDAFIFNLYRNIKLYSILKSFFLSHFTLNKNDEYKSFGKEELEAEEKIIRKNSIQVKDNFFDYY